MNEIIYPEDVAAVVKSFCDCNDGDEATTNLILAIGAELLDVSADTMNEMIINHHVVSSPKILGATLLSVEEAETLLAKDEKIYKKWWWLRTPGDDDDDACYVDKAGYIFPNGYVWDNYGSGVRPALKIDTSSSNIKVGDVFMFGGKEFKVLTPKLAWMHKDDIGCCAFRNDVFAPNTNNYEASDIKKLVDAWFNKAITEI